MSSVSAPLAGAVLNLFPLTFDHVFAVVGLAAIPVTLALLLHKRRRPRPP